jgi:radical SAM superfamily enzyme YgiQ (UPF0313 family)
MKVVLVCALNYHHGEDSYSPVMQPGLLSCAAVLSEGGFDVKIVDPNLLILKGLVEGHDLYESLAGHLAGCQAQLYGFSTFSDSYQQSLRLAEALKRISPGVFAVLGGPQATLTDEMTLRHFPAVDAVVRGEGELTLKELAKRLGEGRGWHDLPGISCRFEGRIVRNIEAPVVEDLDTLPMPAWHLCNLNEMPDLLLDAVRGCPSDDILSSCGVYGRREPRFKSARRLVEEIVRLGAILERDCAEPYPAPSSTPGRACEEPLARRQGTGMPLPFTVEIPNELFTSSAGLLRDFCALARFEIPQVRWRCSGRVGVLDEETMALMAASGCTAISYRIESGSSDIQRDIGTNYQLIDIGDAITLALSNGIHVNTAYTVGFPFEREEDVRHTFELMRRTFLKGRAGLSIHCGLLVPHAGSRIYRESMEKLVYNGYRPEMRSGSPFDRESVCMIVKYPELFSYHYHIAARFLKREVLEEVVELLTVPMEIMPSTSLALWHETVDPFALHRDWKLYNESPMAKKRHKPDCLRGSGLPEFARVFSDFLGHMVRSRFLRTPYLADLAEYELARFTLARKPRKDSPGKGSKTLEPSPDGMVGGDTEKDRPAHDEVCLSSARPVRNCDLAVKSYSFDVVSIASALLLGEQPEDVGPVRTSVIFWQSLPGEVGSVRADETALKALDMCRGKLTAGEIAKRLHGRMGKRVPAGDDPVSALLRSWLRLGIIRCSD